VTVTNSGQTAFAAATFTDSLAGVLDDATYAGGASASTGTVAWSSPNLTWTGNLAAGAAATVTYAVTVKSSGFGNATLTNAVTSASPGSTCPAVSPPPACSTSVPVLIPGLTIVKTAGSTSRAAEGAQVRYTTTITNSGQTAYTGAVVADNLVGVLDDADFNNDATATTGTLGYSAPVLTWTGNLAVGASATVSYTVTVRSPVTGDRQLVNVVTSPTAGSNCPTGGTDPRCRVSLPVSVPGLTIAKTASVGTTAVAGTVGYTITIRNTGTIPYTGTAVADDLTGLLDEAVYGADAVASAGAVSFASPTLTWTGDLAVDATVTVTYSVRVKSFADVAGDRLLVNTVRSDAPGSNCATGSTDARCVTTVPVAQLENVYTTNVTTTVPGGIVRFTLVVRNLGQVPYNGITIDNDAADGFDDVVPNGDQTATYSSGAPAGTLTITATGITWRGNVPIGEVVTIDGTVTVRDPPVGNGRITGTNVSTAPGNNCLPGSTDPRCVAFVRVLLPGLSLHKVASATTVLPGATIQYTITITNCGNAPLTGVTVDDPLTGVLDDADVVPGSISVAVGEASAVGKTLSWTGDLAVNEVVTVTYQVKVRDPDPGDKVLSNTVSSNVTPTVCDPTCSATVQVLTPRLTVAKSVDRATALPNAVVTYTVTITNTGQAAYTGISVADDLSGVLGSAVFGNNATIVTGPGTLSYTAPVLTWSGSLGLQQAVTVRYTITVNSSATPTTLTNTVTSAASGSTCPIGNVDPACRATVSVVAPAALTFTKVALEASVYPGTTLHYRITIANSGGSAGTGDFSDDLTDVLKDAAYNGDITATLDGAPVGTTSWTSPTLSWTGQVPAGGTVIVTYSATVLGTNVGDNLIVNGLVSADPSSNCRAGSTDVRCRTSVPVGSLLIVDTPDPTTTTPGGVVRFTTVIANTGNVFYHGIVLRFTAAGLVDDADLNGDTSATSGVISTESGELRWTGDVPVGGSVTITSSVTVHAVVTGDRMLASLVDTDAPGANCTPGNNDARCQATVPILLPGLAITKALDPPLNPANTTPGATVGYRITVTNTGETVYPGLVVRDALAGALDDAAFPTDAAAVLAGTSTPAGTLQRVGTDLTWTGDLATGTAVWITYTMVVLSPAAGDKYMTDKVSADVPGSTCPTGTTAASCSASVVVLTPALQIVKTADDVTTTVPGGTVRYTIVATNVGQVPYTGITVTDALADVLDDAAYNNDASARTAGVDVGTIGLQGTDLGWTGDLALGAAVTITYSVVVGSPPAGNRQLLNVVSSAAAGSLCPVGAADPACRTSVPVSILTIVNSWDAASTIPTGVVRNTITITNGGATPYTDALVIVDGARVFDDAEYVDVTVTAGSVSLDGTALRWTGTLAPGAGATIVMTVDVNDPPTGDQTMTSAAVSTAVGSSCPIATAPGCTATVTVLLPHLAVTRSPAATSTTPGTDVTFQIVAHNTGQTVYTGAVLTESLAEIVGAGQATYVSSSATSGTLQFASPALTWTGDLGIGASVTITYTFHVVDPFTGQRVLTGRVSSPDVGADCPAGNTLPACASTVTVLIPAMTITKSADVSTAGPGQAVHYTVTIFNSGQAGYPSSTVVTDDLTDVLDDAAYDGNATADAGTVQFTGSAVQWTGPLAVGSTVTVRYSVTPGLGTDYLLTNVVSTVAPGANCPPGGTDPRCSVSVTSLRPALDLYITADTTSVVVGGVVRYSIVLTNTGEAAYPGLTVVNQLDDVLDNATFDNNASATAGRLDFASPLLVWTGDLAVGATAVITYSVTVTSLGDGELTNVLKTAALGATCHVVRGNTNCTNVVVVVERTISLAMQTNGFTLTGPPLTTVEGAPGIVAMTVTTNSPTGYAVTVRSMTVNLLPADAGVNPDVIPASDLHVRRTGETTYKPLSTVAVLVHGQAAPSAPGGDTLLNDYEVDIPPVRPDTYSTTLEYVATTQ
jgi:uncharacterized repeat protein (TIGR01451 family)